MKDKEKILKKEQELWEVRNQIKTLTLRKEKLIEELHKLDPTNWEFKN